MKQNMTLVLAVSLTVLLAAGNARATPKGYDVSRFLQEGLPDWRGGTTEPAPLPPARPLDRLPYVPAPAILPETQTGLTQPPPLPAYTAPGRRVIQAPGAPRSSVSGAWAPRR
ncbi:MAG: hypothetical protein ACKVH0_09640 [Alphaproteobacteria bacterium]|jgi:hypothetical protein